MLIGPPQPNAVSYLPTPFKYSPSVLFCISGKSNYDFSILTLIVPIALTSRARVACLPRHGQNKKKAYKRDHFVGETLIASGWGYFDHKKEPHETLQVMEVQVAPFETCKEYKEAVYLPEMTDAQLCTHNQTSSGCHGDSGGRLCSWFAVIIVLLTCQY